MIYILFTATVCIIITILVSTVFYYKDLSERDGFTNCYNKTWFMSKKNSKLVRLMKKTNKSGKSFGLLYIDMDNFKSVNDEFGHSYGDILITRTVRAMRKMLKEADFIVRVGGDEFLIVLKNIGRESELVNISERISSIVHADTKRTISIGSSIYRKGAPIDTHAFISSVDLDMYKNKRNKKGVQAHV